MFLRSSVVGAVAAALIGAAAVAPRDAAAGDGGKVLLGAVGGLLAGKMISDHEQKKQSEAYQQGAQDQYVAQQQYDQQMAQARQQAAANSPEARLERLKKLRDQGLISDSDYNTQKAAIVSSL